MCITVLGTAIDDLALKYIDSQLRVRIFTVKRCTKPQK